MESRGEACELQQLVSSDVEGDGDDTAQESYNVSRDEKVISPGRSMKVSSSGETSQSSMSRSIGKGFPNISHNAGSATSRITYVNEKPRIGRDYSKMATPRPRNTQKGESKVQHHSFVCEVPDVRHMERALIKLLDDFHSGKLRAFGKGCSMEQMMDIREQQERLAKLHFDLGANIGSGEEPTQQSMTKLVQRLQQLSVSIEKLHSTNN